MMATVHRTATAFLFAVKGAPEAVLAAAERVISDDGDVVSIARRANGLTASNISAITACACSPAP